VIRLRRPALPAFALLSALVSAAASSPARAPAPAAAPAPSPRAVRAPIEGNASVRLDGGRTLLLEAAVAPGEGWAAFTRRWCAPGVAWQKVRDAAGGPAAPARGQRVPIPFALLGEERRVSLLRAAFPQDAAAGGEWIHYPGGSPLETYGETLWDAALWLTGDGANFTRVRRSAASEDPLLQAEETVRIPAELLRPGLRALAGPARAGAAPAWPLAASPAVAAPAVPGGGAEAAAGVDAVEEAAEGEAAVPGLSKAAAALTWGEDGTGKYAIYNLKAGEALYSAVVVRYTGRVDPDEVNETAAGLARVNGISNVTSIPVGFPVKIPFALLEPEFLPPGDPMRADYDRAVAEADAFRNSQKARNLEGVHVILDAGHGGVDPGALAHGLNEHEYVYDVMCRLKKKLEDDTGAVVHPTIRDRKKGYALRSAKSLPHDAQEEILTTPPHRNDSSQDTTIGVNLRWYLANSIFRGLVSQGVPEERIVFISLHADSLHPSLRGGMVYIPGERYRRGTFGSSSGSYTRYGEVRERSSVHFDRGDRLKSEGLSREFATAIIAAMRRQQLAVHPDLPVRDRIIRRGRAWVPAVLRANEVPVKVLVEVANLNNDTDAKLLQDSAFRDRTAAALVDALTRYYKEP